MTRIALDGGSLGQFDDAPMLEATRLLADAGMDVIAWNGTSGSWKGLEADRALVRRIEEETGIGATTSTLDLLEACRALGIVRCGRATPYLAEIHEAIRRVYTTAGLDIIPSISLSRSIARVRSSALERKHAVHASTAATASATATARGRRRRATILPPFCGPRRLRREPRRGSSIRPRVRG